MDGSEPGVDLQAYLDAYAPADLAQTLLALASATSDLTERIRRGPLSGALGASVGVNSDGDAQKKLDLIADEVFEQALRTTPTLALASEERADVVRLAPEGRFLVALDPLDGSSNIDVNVTMGSIFSVLDAGQEGEAAFLRPGHKQRAAGFALYGPQTAFVFTVGAGTHAATLDPSTGKFVVTRQNIVIPEGRAEFAINMSNSRHWPEPIKAYVDDLLMGVEGPRRKDFNMRWVGAMIADVYRVLLRGGVYLYPDDARAGYSNGRLHLLYEANPVAFLIEQAGGLATDGVNRILDRELTEVHARTPLIFGSTDKVENVRSYFLDGHRSASRAPLFGRRGLWRAS